MAASALVPWACPLRGRFAHSGAAAPGAATADDLVPVLLADNIELGSKNTGIGAYRLSQGNQMREALLRLGVPVLRCELPVADFMWALAPRALAARAARADFSVARGDLEGVRVSGLMAERKCVGDLWWSQRDGRYETQKSLMRRATGALAALGAPTLAFYIVEENSDSVPDHFNGGKPVALKPADVTRMVHNARAECAADGFSVIHTRSIRETVHSVVSTAEELAAMHCAAAAELLAAARAGRALPRFADFVRLCLDERAIARKRGRGEGDIAAAGAGAGTVAVDDDDVVIIDDDDAPAAAPPGGARPAAAAPSVGSFEASTGVESVTIFMIFDRSFFSVSSKRSMALS